MGAKKGEKFTRGGCVSTNPKWFNGWVSKNLKFAHKLNGWVKRKGQKCAYMICKCSLNILNDNFFVDFLISDFLILISTN